MSQTSVTEPLFEVGHQQLTTQLACASGPPFYVEAVITKHDSSSLHPAALKNSRRGIYPPQPSERDPLLDIEGRN